MEGILKFILLAVEVIACLLLIGVILLQKPRSYGLGVAFGAATAESLFGAQAGSILTKATVILIAIVILNTMALTLLMGRKGRVESVTDRIRPAPAAVGDRFGAVEQPAAAVSETVPVPATREEASEKVEGPSSSGPVTAKEAE